MQRFVFYITLIGSLLLCSFYSNAADDRTVVLLTGKQPHVRVQYGATQLAKALTAAGYRVSNTVSRQAPVIIIGLLQEERIQQSIRQYQLPLNGKPGKEGFSIVSANKNTLIAGADASGALYGCLEMAERIRQTGTLPANFRISDQPEMVLRGACVGIQKTTYLPGRTVYEYPYTPG
ncbi:MAG TPA: hypothetical protein VGD35_03330, partial [Chitinophaga sp.]